MKVCKKNNKKEKRGKKKMGIVIGVIAAVVVVVAVVVGTTAGKNVKAMNSCVEATLAELKKHYTVTPRDAGEYKQMKIYDYKMGNECLTLFV